MSHRAEQLASILHRAVQQVLADGLSDPRLSGTIITVTRVKVTGDLRSAIISVSILPADREKLAMHALRAAAGHIRHLVSDLVSLHRTPTLEFKLDSSLKREAAVLAALSEVADERDHIATKAHIQPNPSPESEK